MRLNVGSEQVGATAWVGSEVGGEFGAVGGMEGGLLGPSGSLGPRSKEGLETGELGQVVLDEKKRGTEWVIQARALSPCV